MLTGAIDSSTISVLNSTFTGNAAANYGGSIYLHGGTLTMGNSIVSGNTAPNGKEMAAPNPFGSSAKFVSLGHNLFGENGSDGLVNVARVASDRVLPGAIATALGPLQNNGGPTATLLPVAGSLAINGGSNALIPAGTTTDQRGPGFPRIVGGTVDIGAVERGPSYRLSASKQGGNGLVTSNPTGINCGPTCAAEFAGGMKVTLAAKPDAGYSFTGWLGDCTGTTCTLTMNAAKSVTALFSNATTHRLTVTKAGYGLGAVTGPGIACGADCTESYPVDTPVTLTATAAAGSRFGGWSGCDTVNAALRQCTVKMASARTVRATFDRPLLTVRKAGTGTGLVGSFGPASGIFCGTDCTEPYNFNTVVYLVALPAPGSTLVGWTGCAANASFPQLCTTTMTASRTVTANFAR